MGRFLSASKDGLIFQTTDIATVNKFYYLGFKVSCKADDIVIVQQPNSQVLQFYVYKNNKWTLAVKTNSLSKTLEGGQNEF